ncbi:tetratricopeptide repeat protein [Alkalibaculum bacchi]|nr:tetratricopeptide repeat protein [Alkalibaculum bacchi]
MDELRLKAKAYNDLKEYEKALNLYEEIRKESSDYLEKYCLFNYMWCLYRVKIAHTKAFYGEEYPKTQEYIRYILKHTKNSDILYQMTVFKVLKFYKSKENFEAEKINQWLDKLDPSKLSQEPFKLMINGRETEQQSYKESWYALKSKVYEHLELYEDVLRITQEALEIFPKLHNNNNIWLRRRMAIALWKLGDGEQAIKILEELIRYRKEWYMYMDLCHICTSRGNNQKALSYATDAMLSRGEDSKKINVFSQTAKILQKMGNEKSNIIKQYVIKLKLENQWRFSQEEKSIYEANKEFIDTYSIEKYKKAVTQIAKNLKSKM